MAARLAGSIDLGQLGLTPGGGFGAELDVVVEPFSFGGQDYLVAESPLPVRVDVSRTGTGYVTRARSEATLRGPCMRCFDAIPLAVTIDARDVHEPAIAPEMASDYVDDADVFDLASFVRDTIGLALPATMSGELDDAGGCRLCGRDRGELAEMGVGERPGAGEPDPRWAKLKELKIE